MDYNKRGIGDGGRAQAAIKGWASTPVAFTETSPSDYNISMREKPVSPDNYGFVDWGADAFTTFMVSLNQIQEQSSYGRLARNINPQLDLVNNAKKAFEIETRKEELNKALETQPERVMEIIGELKKLDKEDADNKYTESFNDLLNSNKWNITPDTDLQTKWSVLENYENELLTERDELLNDIQTDRKDIEDWQNRHNVSAFYQARELAGNIEFTSADTYLYKMPGLIGSSSATPIQSIAALGGAAFAGSGLGAQAGASIGTAVAGPGPGTAAGAAIGTGAGAVIGGAVSIGSNLSSRQEETYAELSEAYKAKVRQAAETQGIDLDIILRNGRAQMQRLPQYQGVDITDEMVEDAVYFNVVKSGDTRLDRIRYDAYNGLETLYQNNMMLSGWDVVQTAIDVFPLSRVWSSVGKNVRKLVNASKYADKVSSAERALSNARGIGQKINQKLNQAAMFGLSKDVSSIIGRRSAIKQLLDIGGNVIVSSLGEGIEEGSQFIFSKDYETGKYGINPSFLTSAISTFGAGARSAMAYVGIPWDPELVGDDELIDSMKGGMLLGGLMTGMYRTGGTALGHNARVESNRVAAERAQELMTNGQVDYATEGLRQKAIGRDNIRKGVVYSNIALNNRSRQIKDSFNLLRNANIEGLTPDMIDAEIADARRIISQANSEVTVGVADLFGIDDQTTDYGIYNGLIHNYRNRLQEATEEQRETTNNYVTLSNSPEVDAYLESYPEEQRDAVRQAVNINASLQSIERLQADLDKADGDLASVPGVPTSLEERKEFRSRLSEMRKMYKQLDTNLRRDNPFLNYVSNYQIPSINDQLVEAAYLSDIANITAERAQADFRLVDPVFQARIIENFRDDAEQESYIEDISKQIRDKIEAYKDAINRDLNIEQSLYEEAAGIKETEQTVVVEKPVDDTITATVPNRPDNEQTTERSQIQQQQGGTAPSPVQPINGEPVVQPSDDANTTIQNDDANPELTTKVKVDFEGPSWQAFVQDNAELFESIDDSEVGNDEYNRAYSQIIDKASEKGWEADPNSFTFYVANEPVPPVEIESAPDPLPQETPTIVDGVEQPVEPATGNYTELSQLLDELMARRSKYVTQTKEEIPRRTPYNPTQLREERNIKSVTNWHPDIAYALEGALDAMYNLLVEDDQMANIPSRSQLSDRLYRTINDNNADILNPTIGELYQRMQDVEEAAFEASSDATIQQTIRDLQAFTQQVNDGLRLSDSWMQDDLDTEITLQEEQEDAAPVDMPVIPEAREAEPELPQQDMPNEMFEDPQPEVDVDAIEPDPIIPNEPEPSQPFNSHEGEFKSIPQDISQQLIDLDTLSHLVFYNPNWTWTFEGYPNSSPLSELMEATINEDFLTNSDIRLEVGSYRGSRLPLIIIEYGEKQWVAKFPSRNDLNNFPTYARMNEASKANVRLNIEDLRAKVLSLDGQIKSKGLSARIVPTNVTRTTGKLRRNSGEDGRAIQRPINQITGLAVPQDPMDINADNTFIVIAGGELSNDNYARRRDDLMYVRGGSGTLLIKINPLWDNPSRPSYAKLNSRKFTNDPDIADRIIQMMIRPEQYFITADGRNSSIPNQQILDLFVYNGYKTRVDPRFHEQTSPELLTNLKNKQLYKDGSTIVISGYPFEISDLVFNQEGKPRNPKVYADAQALIMNNMNWSLSKENVWDNFANYNQFHRDHPLNGFVDWFALRPDADKFVIVPGKIEFTRQQVLGDENHPNGISMLGWYVSQGAILSDLADIPFTNANLYIEDVMIEGQGQPQYNTTPELQEKAAEGIVTNDEAKTDEPSNDIPDVIKNLNKRLFGENGFIGLTVDNTTEIEETVNIENARKWVSSRLGIEVEQVEVADTTMDVFHAGTRVVAGASVDSIMISDIAPIGSEFHEAWHRVSELLITPERRNRLNKRINRKFFNNRYNLDDVNELKRFNEEAAELYRNFMISNDKLGDFRTSRWFNAIRTFVTGMSQLRDFQLSRMYAEINFGKYRNVPPRQENVDRFRQIYGEGYAPKEVLGIQFTHINSINDFYDIVDSLMAYLLLTSNTTSIDSIDNINWEPLQGDIAIAAETNGLYAEIQDKWGSVFAPAIVDRINSLGIRGVQVEAAEVLESLDAGESLYTSLQDHLRDSDTIDHKTNVAAEVKFLIATVPKYDFIDNVPTLYVSDNTGLAKFANFGQSWNNIIAQLHDKETIAEMKTAIDRLAKTDPFFYAFKERFDSLTKDESRNILTQLEVALRTHRSAFSTTRFGKDENNNIVVNTYNATIDRDARAYPIVWSQNLLDDPRYFSENEEGNLEISDENKRNLREAKEAYNTIMNLIRTRQTRYNTTGDPSSFMIKYRGRDVDLRSAEGVSVLKKNIISVLNNIGITIDNPRVIDSMLETKEYYSSDPYQAVVNLLTSTAHGGGFGSLFGDRRGIIGDIIDSTKFKEDGLLKGIYNTTSRKFVPFNRVFTSRRFVKELALHNARLTASSTELSDLGPDGVRLYSISQHNYVTNRTQDLHKSYNADGNIEKGSILYNLKNVTYNIGSLFHKQMIEGKNHPILKLQSFAAFKEDSIGDRGRDYFSISPREDYVTKMNYVLNDMLVFPTLADKKRHHTLTGLLLPKGRINWTAATSVTAGDVGYNAAFADGVVNQFLDYAYSDLAVVEQALQQQTMLPREALITNYHISPDGKIDKANGTKFRFMQGIYEVENGELTFTNFNDPAKTDAENLQTAKDRFFGRSREDQIALMNTYMNQAVKQEVHKVAELGLIGLTNKEGVPFAAQLRNELLEETRINERADFYRRHDDLIVRQNALSYGLYDLIAENTLGTIMSLQEIERIFVGDPAFFKQTKGGLPGDTSIDKYKRLGGMTSTGANNRLDWPIGHPLHGVTEYTATELDDIYRPSQQREWLHNAFLYGNLRDALKVIRGLSDEDITNILKQPIDEVRKQFPEIYNQVSAKSEIQSGSYRTDGDSEGINIADAEVIVSPQMYRNMMQISGRWSAEIREAYNILQSEDTDWLNDPERYFKALRATLQPLKYTSYGTRFDAGKGLGIPFYNKMAIFPLFRFMATGENLALYERMNRPGNEIDMVLFNSAVKVGSQAPSEFNPNTLEQLVTYKQEYRYLRDQLNTDPHISEQQAAGTQMIKITMSNLNMDKQYGYGSNKRSGRQIHDEVMSAINQLSDIGRERVLNQTSTQLEDGSYEIDYEKLSQMFTNEAKNSNANMNVMDGVRYVDGGFNLPLSALSDNNWLESRLNSFVNRHTINLELPGGAFVQMSAFGFSREEGTILPESVYNRWGLNNNGVRLRLHNNVDGSMDAIVSINLFRHMIPNYDNLTFIQARQYLLDNNIIGENSTAEGIGYRIPTQAVASVSAMRFMDVMPSVLGDVVVLPEEITKLTGSDFDIDKMFIATYSYDMYVQTRHEVDDETRARLAADFRNSEWNDNVREFLRREHPEYEYNPQQDKFYVKQYGIRRSFTEEGKQPSERSLKNDIISNYIRILTDEDTQHVLKQSIDVSTGKIKSVLKDIEQNRPNEGFTPFNTYLPSYQQQKKEEYTRSKTGIGPMALNTAHHVLTQLYGVNMRDEGVMKKHGVNILSGVFDRVIDGQQSPSYILDWLSALVNAFVDIAKDPYISRMNVNPQTYNMTTFLIRSGMGENTFYFMGQPILKEAAAEAEATTGSFGTDPSMSEYTRKRNAMRKVRDKYMGEARRIATPNQGKLLDELYQNKFNNADIFRAEIKSPTTKHPQGQYDSVLRGYLRHNTRDFTYYYNQLLVFKTWDELEPLAQELADLVKFSKVDTKRFGTSTAEHEQFLRGIRRMKRSKYFERGSVARMFSDSFLDKKAENSMMLTQRLMSNLLLRNTPQARFDFNGIIASIGKLNNLDQRTARAINNGLEAQVKADFFNEYVNRNNINIVEMFYGDNTMARRLEKIKQRIKESYEEMVDSDGSIKNDLINLLIPKKSNVYDRYLKPDFINTDALLSNDPYFNNNVIMAWQELLESEHDDVRRFAEELVIYSFYSSGDISGINSFFNYLPNGYRKRIGYSDYIQNLMDNQDQLAFNRREFFVNNWFNNDLVPEYQYNIQSTATDEYGVPIVNENGGFVINDNFLEGLLYEDGVFSYPYLILGIREGQNSPAIRPVTKLDGKSYYRPFIKIRTKRGGTPDSFVLYEYVGYYNEVLPTNNREIQIPMYQAVNKKGMRYQGNTVFESDPTKSESILPFNNIPYYADFVGFIRNGVIDNALTPLLSRESEETQSYYRNAFSNLITGYPTEESFIDNYDNSQDGDQPVYVNNNVDLLNYSNMSDMPSTDGGYINMSFRSSTDEHFASPFTTTGANNTIQLSTEEDVAHAYIKWLKDETATFTDVNEVEHTEVAFRQREWINMQRENGDLQGRTIVYHKNINDGEYYSYADAFKDYLNGLYSEPTIQGNPISVNNTGYNVANDYNTDKMTLSTPENRLEVYSDGSHIKNSGQMGFGAVFQYNGETYNMSGTEISQTVQELQEMFPDAEFSNPTMELLALLETLKSFDGRGEHITIRQDYTGVVNYEGLWDKSDGSQHREKSPWKARKPYIKYLVEQSVNEIAKIEQAGGSVQIMWTEAHSGDAMNDLADSAAKNRENFNNFTRAYERPSDKCN